jgi:hypothetical protein
MIVTPVFRSPPDLRCEAGPLAGWFTTPEGGVVQLTEAGVFTKQMAEWIVGPGYDALTKQFPGATNMSLVLDLRALLAREPAALSVIMGAATKYLSSTAFGRVAVIPPAKPPPLYMVTLRGAVALANAIGPEVKVYESIEDALSQLQLRAAR